MDKSLEELKLCPSATIILQKCKLEDVEQVGKPPDSANEASSSAEMDTESTGNDGSNSTNGQGNAKLYQEAIERRLNLTTPFEGGKSDDNLKF